ncbi:MAG: saccharopine dehydrogenase NADP-binding domain-containing protein [Thermodesulfobacteriota bacterium]|nr:saccharopine dehydrogenase NADP-binding domain-containing protein [Thermodesulfobacteriota bacterium]
MAKVIVLGGCGAVGSVAVKTLVNSDVFSEIVIGDVNIEKANELISQLGSEKLSAIKVDASDENGIKDAVRGSNLVVNCVGPFYKTVKNILKAVIDAGINYVDICDDVDVTVEILEMDNAARKAGITALIGMGNSPGATNIIAKFVADKLLDEVDSISIFHVHGGEPVEGKGVIGHRFHCMSIDIPMFLDGKLKYVKYFGEDGIALRQTFDFPVVGEVPLYPYPHPEQVSIPRYITCREVTNKGSVIPNEYYNLIRDMCRLGLSSKESLDIDGQTVIPQDFAMAYIVRERERILKQTGFGTQRGCCSTVVKGKKDGEYREYRVHMASKSQALGEGTGIPAAIGAILMQQGKIAEKGVFPPEGCVDPQDFLDILPQVIKLDKVKEGGESFGGLIVEMVDEKGNIKKIDI